MIYRIEPLLFSLIWFKELNLVSKKATQKIEIIFFFFFLEKWLTELNSLWMTHRIEPLWTSSQFDSKSWSLSFQYDAKNWTFLVFQYDSRNWTYLVFQYDSKNWTFLLILTQRSERFFEYDSKNWIFFEHDSKESNLPLFGVWLKELTFFFNMIQRIEFFFMTHKIEPPFWRRLKESNPFFWTQHQKLNFCLKIQKATFFLKNSKKSNHFQKNMTQRIEPFFVFFFDSNIWNMTQRMNLLFEPLFFKEMKFCFFFSFWLKELKPFVFLKMSQRIEPLFHMSYFFTRLKELIFFNMTQRFFQIDSKELNSLFSMTQRNDLVSPKWRTELNPYFECDAKNGTLFSLNTTQRIEPFFLWMRRRELNPLSLNMTQRIESFFFEYDAKNWKLCL